MQSLGKDNVCVRRYFISIYFYLKKKIEQTYHSGMLTSQLGHSILFPFTSLGLCLVNTSTAKLSKVSGCNKHETIKYFHSSKYLSRYLTQFDKFSLKPHWYGFASGVFRNDPDKWVPINLHLKLPILWMLLSRDQTTLLVLLLLQ